MKYRALTEEEVKAATERLVGSCSVIDIHTHLFPPRFNHHDGRFLLWGIDALLDYHYLQAEVLRSLGGAMSPTAFLSMPRRERAELTWRTLFRERAPLSESCRGVITTLTQLGIDPETDSLAPIRDWFAQRELDDHVDAVMRLAGVERITMTNEVFDPIEHAAWFEDDALAGDLRFAPVVRVDRLLCDPEGARKHLQERGYDDSDELTSARRFVSDWVARTSAVYVAASLPSLDVGGVTPGGRADHILREGILPALEEHGVPLALMIGVRRGVNPDLASAGDGSGPSDLRPLEDLCARTQGSGVRLLVTMLAREDQHALCVVARKFAHMVPFGCWWFLNTRTSIEDMTRLRLELLGNSFIPQHSDARVLEQLIYKWSHTREVLTKVLSDHLCALVRLGQAITEPLIKREVDELFRGKALKTIPYERVAP